jgi:hypothetical protein
MLALSIRQPFAELILRGMKRIEYRSRSTRIIGERFWIYAAKGRASKIAPSERVLNIGHFGAADRPGVEAPSAERPVVKLDNLSLTAPPPWMVELANGLRLFAHQLPTGVIVGSAMIEKVVRGEGGMFEWHLSDVERAARLRSPTGHPQPVWFTPFQ